MFKLEIPKNSKITFGAGNIHGMLRIYEGTTEKSNLLCCFPNVCSFHDESVVQLERAVVGDGGIEWRQDNGWHDHTKRIAKKLRD